MSCQKFIGICFGLNVAGQIACACCDCDLWYAPRPPAAATFRLVAGIMWSFLCLLIVVKEVRGEEDWGRQLKDMKRLPFDSFGLIADSLQSDCDLIKATQLHSFHLLPHRELINLCKWPTRLLPQISPAPALSRSLPLSLDTRPPPHWLRRVATVTKGVAMHALSQAKSGPLCLSPAPLTSHCGDGADLSSKSTKELQLWFSSSFPLSLPLSLVFRLYF